MRNTIKAFLALLLVSFTLPAMAQQWGRPRPPRDGACFYSDAGFRGDYFCVAAGERIPVLPPGFNDRISSVRLFGRAKVRIFNDTGFHGVHSFMGRDVIDLRQVRVPDNPYKNWGDRISSIAVFAPDRDEWRDFDWRGNRRHHDHDHDVDRDRDRDRDYDHDRWR